MTKTKGTTGSTGEEETGKRTETYRRPLAYLLLLPLCSPWFLMRAVGRGPGHHEIRPGLCPPGRLPDRPGRRPGRFWLLAAVARRQLPRAGGRLRRARVGRVR